MSVDVSKILKGDKVKVSLYGLPESDWLKVSGTFPSYVEAAMPNGGRKLLTPSEITAHEPAAPALPEWWGSLVIHAHGIGYYPYDQNEDDYVGVAGISRRPEFFENVDVTVIVDRDGNPPAVDNAWAESGAIEDERIDALAALAAARADLAAFRAEVAKVRDGHSHSGRCDLAGRLTAILDGADYPVNADYTPTTAEARNAYQHSVMVSGPEMRERMGREFDRWLAEHERAVKAEALRGFADSTRFPSHWILFRREDGSGVTVGDLLRETADAIEKGTDQ